MLVGDQLQSLASGVRIARDVPARIRRNQARSLVYNLIAMASAAAGWVNPLVAAVLMPLSSAVVIASAARVERVVEDAPRRSS